MASCITIVPVLIHNKTPIVTLKREKARNVMFAKQLQIEARKAKLISLYDTNDPEKIKPKTRREYIEEFIINTINDSTFISINWFNMRYIIHWKITMLSPMDSGSKKELIFYTLYWQKNVLNWIV